MLHLFIAIDADLHVVCTQRACDFTQSFDFVIKIVGCVCTQSIRVGSGLAKSASPPLIALSLESEPGMGLPSNFRYDFIGKVLITPEQIEKRVTQLGMEITEDYQHSEGLMLIGLLRGSVIFVTDLMRRIHRPIDDFKATDRMTINDRNIAALVRFYLGKPVEPPPAAAPSNSDEPEGSSAGRFKWFNEAKYGLFINWGLYSIPAGEWKGKKYPNIGEWIMYDAKIPVKEYEQLTGQFNPTKFNADEWAQLAVDAGMKYLVFDCKHHDGFALYHSEVSKYNCYDATPWKRDPFKELQAACDKRGLKLCFYYSQATDWHEPNGANNDWDFSPNPQKDFDQYFRDKSMPQVRELLTNYGSIGLIWFDVPTLMTPVRCQQLVDLVRSIQPGTLINSRLGPGGLQDYQSRGDNEIPHAVTPGEWETAATINDTWGYKENDHNWKTPGEICFKLVDIVSKGGNYLLNVGPDADGQIPPPSQDVLRKVGAWLKTNGEAIYDAGRTPFGPELGTPMPGPKDKRGQQPFDLKRDWRCTTKPGKIYLHLFNWPTTGKFEVPGLQSKVNKAYLLSDRKELKVDQTAGGVNLSLPAGAPDTIASVICLEIADQVARGAEQK